MRPNLLLTVIGLCAGCTEQHRGSDDGDGGVDAALPWDEGGTDLPEYSLGRLLLAHPEEPRLTVFDLDSESVAGTLPFAPGAHVFAGGTGRYAYAHDRLAGALRVIDPGQWLLSHIDHFHIAESELGLRDEQLSIERISSFSSGEGWLSVFDALRGEATALQERSITAMAFAPVSVTVEPHAGVSLVSHAHLFVSETADGEEGIALRSVLEPSVQLRHVPGCSAPSSIAAEGGDVAVACAQGLFLLTWEGPEPGQLSALLAEPVAGEGRPRHVRMMPGGGVLFDLDGHKLVLRRSEERRELALDAPILDFQVRRQGTAALVLTADGMLTEVTLPELRRERALAIAEPRDEASLPRFTLSHAYAYVVDPRLSAVLAVRLRTLEVEARFELDEGASDVALVGMPANYVDERE